MNPTIALCITHAAHDARRQKSMERLRADLHLGDIALAGAEGAATVPIFGRILYREETERAPHHVWSKNQWEWGASLGADWVLYLQDDVLVAPDFWVRLEDVLRDVMNYENRSILSLLTNHLGARLAFVEGASGYWTRDGVMGNGYAATPKTLADVLAWRDLEVVPGSAERISEDVLLSLYALSREQLVYTPLPGLIDHDLTVGTLHAHEHGWNRRAYVRWDDEDRRTGLGDEGDEYSHKAQHFGRYYETAHQMLPGVLLDAEHAFVVARRAEEDVCPPRFARWREMIVAQPNWPGDT